MVQGVGITVSEYYSAPGRKIGNKHVFQAFGIPESVRRYFLKSRMHGQTFQLFERTVVIIRIFVVEGKHLSADKSQRHYLVEIKCAEYRRRDLGVSYLSVFVKRIITDFGNSAPCFDRGQVFAVSESVPAYGNNGFG